MTQKQVAEWQQRLQRLQQQRNREVYDTALWRLGKEITPEDDIVLKPGQYEIVEEQKQIEERKQK